jgi:endo-1,4-beta-xylanase
MTPSRPALLLLTASVALPALLSVFVGAQPATPADSRAPSTWTWNVPEPVPGMIHGELHSASMDRLVGFNVCLPASYEREPARRYPVVYFLHGASGTERSDTGFGHLARDEIAAGRIDDVIYVFPNGGKYSGYVDWPDQNVKAETWLVHELIPHIDATYRTLGTREGRAAAGYSMGGGGALRLAVKHPELFCAVASLAGAFDLAPQRAETRATPDWVAAHADRLRDRLALMFVVGGRDRLLARHHRLLAVLDEHRLPYVYAVHPELAHNLGHLTAHYGRDMIRWLAQHYAPASP